MEDREELEKIWIKVIGKVISEKRKAMKLTQKKLAESVHCGVNHIGNIENGKKASGSFLYNNLLRELNLDLNEINAEFDEAVEEHFSQK